MPTVSQQNIIQGFVKEAGGWLTGIQRTGSLTSAECPEVHDTKLNHAEL